MKKKTIIPLAFSLVFLIIGISLGIKQTTSNIQKRKPEKMVSIKKTNLKICKTKNCFAGNMNLYYTLTVNTNNEKLKKIIENINNETNKQKKQTLKSTLNDESCAGLNNKYNYSYISNIEMNLYENDKYLSIAFQRENTNLCTEQSIKTAPEVYIYSKKQDKILSQKEFQKAMKIDLNKVEANIVVSIDTLNKTNNTNNTLASTLVNGKQNLKFFYDSFGKVKCYYYQSGTNSYNIVNIN